MGERRTKTTYMFTTKTKSGRWMDLSENHCWSNFAILAHKKESAYRMSLTKVEKRKPALGK